MCVSRGRRPDQWDFAAADQKLDEYKSIDPNALFLPRILLTPGDWFGELYPDEITRRDDGSPAGMFGRGTHPSFASEKYRELSHKLMIAFISHLEEKYGDRIVGYQVGNGFGGEWLPFNSFWETRGDAPHPTRFGVEDYSPASIKAFRTWLRRKYGNDVTALRKAWGGANVTFDTAEAPGEVSAVLHDEGNLLRSGAKQPGARLPDVFQRLGRRHAPGKRAVDQGDHRATGRS